MRVLKTCLALVVISILTNVISASAIANGTGIIGGVSSIGGLGGSATTGEFTKELYVTQSLKNTTTYTTITNPCKDCEIKTELYSKNSNDSFSKLATTYTTMGKKGIFANSSLTANPGKYKLKHYRNGVTAVTTTIAYDWCIDNVCN